MIFSFLFLNQLFSQESKEVPKGFFVPNFRDVEIQDFLKTMAQITRHNILVDDTVRGKITIVAYKPIPVSRALEFLRSVLEVRGFTVVEDGGLLKVYKKKEAEPLSEVKKQEPAKSENDIITMIYKVPKVISVRELADLFRKLGGNDVTVHEFPSSYSIILTGYGPVIKRILEVAQEILPQKEEQLGADTTDTVHIYHVKHLQAESLANVLVKLDAPIVGKEEKPTPAPVGKIKAVAHKESNTLIVTANREEWVEIRRIIEQLDIPRKQILLEVLIAEVSGSDINDFGIDWRYIGPDAGYTQFNTGLAIEGNLIDEKGNITGNNTLSGFSIGFLQRGGDLLGILNANVSRRNFNVLSAPQILTLDNQEAEINVGQDVPVKTQERTTGGGTAEATINSFEYRPAGIKLKFTPHINPEGKINLELFTEVTNIEGGITLGVNPVFSKRNVRTFITVDNKQTIVIGGLVSTEKLKAIQKVPLLGDIPLLGFLFRRTTFTTKKTNLMVFLTPTILDNKEIADHITNSKREQQNLEYKEATEKIHLWPQDKPKTDEEIHQKQIKKEKIHVDEKKQKNKGQTFNPKPKNAIDKANP
ncbi:MAG: secretin N-terminal domain-containing protein [Leptospiraceae bacterium]|nr:secretin N-terminal domain-containing protein [Leptospiraceae bacterium]